VAFQQQAQGVENILLVIGIRMRCCNVSISIGISSVTLSTRTTSISTHHSP
jgi:hypothetical protein